MNGIGMGCSPRIDQRAHSSAVQRHGAGRARHLRSVPRLELAFNEVYAEAQKTQPWKQWAEDGARQMVESGTTAAADIVTDLDAAGALASQGMHGTLIGR